MKEKNLKKNIINEGPLGAAAVELGGNLVDFIGAHPLVQAGLKYAASRLAANKLLGKTSSSYSDSDSKTSGDKSSKTDSKNLNLSEKLDYKSIKSIENDSVTYFKYILICIIMSKEIGNTDVFQAMIDQVKGNYSHSEFISTLDSNSGFQIPGLGSTIRNTGNITKNIKLITGGKEKNIKNESDFIEFLKFIKNNISTIKESIIRSLKLRSEKNINGPGVISVFREIQKVCNIDVVKK